METGSINYGNRFMESVSIWKQLVIKLRVNAECESQGQYIYPT